MPAPEDATCTIGNPALPGSGVKLHSETDFEGAGASALMLQRFYRSKFSAAEIPSYKNWTHTYSAQLYRSPLPRDLSAMRSDGSVWRFQFDPVALRWSSSETRSSLTEVRDSQGVYTGFQLLDSSNDSTETYDTVGKLLSFRQRNSWTTTLQYNAQQMLASVTNHFGRQLIFTYDTAGRMTSMTAPGGEITRYGHDTVGNLTSVTWPDGNIKRYHYEDSRHPHVLTGITDETGYRIGHYTYDAQGRVIETQRAGGVDRYQLAYGQDANGLPQTRVTDFSTGTPTSRTYNFVAQGRALRPSAVSAPCPLCGSTAKATQYNAAGNKTREVAHDGQVTFYLYNAKGQETERATFPSSFASVTTRPALSNATSVVSTQWHGTWNLPNRITEPGRNTTYSYNARGITATSTSATTDATGAAKFSATLTGPVATAQYGYNANNLNTRITELTDGVQTQQWTLAYNELGDLTRITDVTKAQSARITQYTADGRVLRGTTDQGVAIAVTYSLRGAITQITRGTQTVRFAYNTVGTLVQARTPDNQVIDYVLDANQAIVDVKLNGASVSAQMLALGDYPDSTFKGLIESAKQALIQSIEELLREANAQVVVFGGGRGPAPPVFDPRTDMLMSPMGDPDRAVRTIQEMIARACRCDPNQGFGAPKFTAVTFAHVFGGGHVVPMFSDQSYFSPTEKVGQALVDEVISRAAGNKVPDGTRDIYNINMGRVVGMRYDKGSTSSNSIEPTQWVTMVVERNNCSSTWRFNEVVTMYPDEERK